MQAATVSTLNMEYQAERMLPDLCLPEVTLAHQDKASDVWRFCIHTMH